MYLWRRRTSASWLIANEERLRARSGEKLAIIARPNRKQLEVEAACNSSTAGRNLIREFGGRLEKLSNDWLERFSRNQNNKELKIGNRLVITNVGGTLASRVRARHRTSPSDWRTGQASRHQGRSHILIIPAGTAFGTGEHVTTAMSLRLLERVTRPWKSGWSLADLGTGSGILALAASRFGATRVLAIEMDPVAIWTAKENGRRNKIENIDFQLGDVRQWKSGTRFDFITANLFSELLIEILPKLRKRLSRDGWLIISGILRAQEARAVCALRRNRIEIVQVRRRGKWTAILCRGSGGSPNRQGD